MTWLRGARIVLPDAVIEGHALLLADGRIVRVASNVPRGEPAVDLGGGWLMPGFIDTQVNGGGDVLFNDAPTPQGIAAIANAHRRFGTTGLLPTLVSDTPEVIAAAIDAVDQAMARGFPGVLGIHIEGPFINQAKKGIHPTDRIRALDEQALEQLSRPGRGVRLVTLAPELAPGGSIERLAKAGVRVAAGHSLADYAQTRSAIERGVSGFTHLFNAMTPLGSREPGMVGAALDDRTTVFGLIADGHHVHPATMRAALRARGDAGVMLVTDAMPPVGGTASSFRFGGTEIYISDGRLIDAQGTLGGSMLTMVQAFRNAIAMLGVDIPAASRLASGNAARFLDVAAVRGAIAPELAADLVHLDDDLQVTGTWVGGIHSGEGERSCGAS